MDTEIEAVLEKADQLVSWASDIKEYALQRAISGKQWNGYKVVEGRSNRKYTDEAKVIEKVKAWEKSVQRTGTAGNYRNDKAAWRKEKVR